MELLSQRRGRWAMVALLVSIVLMLGFVAPKHAEAATSAELSMGSLVNKARVAAGRAPLSLRSNITYVAHRWSANMAAKRRLYHNPYLARQLAGISWSYLGENVGYGSTVAGVFNAFMKSAPHKANILNGRYKRIGIGVVAGGGKYWVTLDFVG